MSQLIDMAAISVELGEVKLSESVTMMGLASDTKFVHNQKGGGLRIYYCDKYIVFASPGYAPKAIGIGFMKEMTTLEDMQNAEGALKAIKEAEQLKAKAAELEALANKQREAEAYRAAKAATVEAKAKNPAFAASAPVEGEEAAKADAAADMAATPAPPPVAAAEMLKDMRAERGTMGDEEERSMKASIARAEARNRRKG